jgi:hypothetical protein
MTQLHTSQFSKFQVLLLVIVAGIAACPFPLFCQQITAPSTGVPPLIQFSGVLTDNNGKPLTGTVGVTFSLYQDSEGGAPLWMETQNARADKNGHYSVMLGAATSQGLPSQLFASGEARWLGVQPQGQVEQARVFLVAVPYALKAADAETLGGKPLSAFTLAAPLAVSGPSAAGAGSSPATPGAPSPTIGGGGTAGYIADWKTQTTLGNSLLFQTAGRNLGISTTSPTQKFEVDSGNMLVRGPNNFTKAGDTAKLFVGDKNHSIEAIYASGLAIGTYKVPQAIFLQDKTGNVGIGTSTPTAGILTAVANSGSVVGVSATGWNASNGSNANGFDAIHATGGNADPSSANTLTGGAGLVATGGAGAGSTYAIWGPGVVANGGSAGGYMGGASGDGIIANGGGGDEYDATGGAGITATGGQGIDGAPGGVFTGGSGRYGAGDGIDVAPGSGASPIVAGYFCCTESDGYDFAGDFGGDINVSGAIYAGTKDFKIDHPLDPANKYLIHASVESSEMMNIYTGNVTLDDKGAATVQLPSWFQALNGDFRYQLTAIGQPSPGLYVAQEISGNQFRIAGGAPGGKVSWQVAGVRHDAYAKANPLLVEREKTFERGYFIHPRLYGAPDEKGIEWVRHPRFTKYLRELRTKNLANMGKAQTVSGITKTTVVPAAPR